MSSRLFVCVFFLFMVGISVTTFANDSEKVKTPATEQVLRESSRANGVTMTPCYLTANDLSIATGQPSLVTMSNGSMHLPVWSLSGQTEGQSVVGIIPELPRNCTGVKIEIVVTTTDAKTSPEFEDVYRVHLSQMVPKSTTGRYVLGDCVRTPLSQSPFQLRTIVLESYFAVDPQVPLSVRIQREPQDKADTFIHPTGLVMVKVTPVGALNDSQVVQNVSGYNSWPMIQSIGPKLVCIYSRGSAHSIAEDSRAVYARTSTDNGKTWTPETIVASTPKYGEVAIGKGIDSIGAMLLWVRRIGAEWNHDLYRSTDGVKFTLIATPKLEVMPIQITDVFPVPSVGLMALWFAGKYNDDGPSHSWGTLTSSDNGITWKQNVIENKLIKADWPTEQAAVYLGKGKILAIARTETTAPSTLRSQFQLVSSDYGKTWKRSQTNISDVMASTPSLVLDSKTGLLSNYYYHRGRGVVRTRIVEPEKIFNKPSGWPESKPVTTGSDVTWDAGNANATTINGMHCIAFYSGKGKHTSVFVTTIPAP